MRESLRAPSADELDFDGRQAGSSVDESDFGARQARPGGVWPHGAAHARNTLWGPLLGSPSDTDCEDFTFHDGD